MGFRYAVLISLILLPALANAEQPVVPSSCLACHVSHFTAQGSCTGCHGGNPRTTRKNIAHKNIITSKYAYFNLSSSVQVHNGKKLIAQSGCRRCHVIFKRGNRIASDLDRLFSYLSPQNIDRAIRNPAQQMPDFRLTNAQRTDVVNAIEYAGMTTGKKRSEDIPQVVHFSKKKNKSEDIFEKNCGGCHKMLTITSGGMGFFEIGPNLSGLFSEFYPAAFRGEKQWNPENLKKWLKNPRTVRSDSTMRPVVLSPEDQEKLMLTFTNM